MSPIDDHPMRYKLANELHARPFPAIAAPSHVVFLAIKREEDAANRNKAADLAHLLDLLDRHGAAHPPPDATHFSGQIGRYMLKWESHSEFVTYSVFCEGLSARPFDPAAFDVFPEDWLAAAPGVRVTSALIHIDHQPEEGTAIARLREWFVPESLAVSAVLDRSAVLAGDFRIDEAGHMRFAIFVAPEVGVQRIGRIVQRICEIETYKAMSMLGFHRARSLSKPMAEIGARLGALTEEMADEISAPDSTLTALLPISAELEHLMAQTSYRFGATGAYAAIVAQRVEILREERFEGAQTFGEFMMRRYDPAMRTVNSSERQLRNMAKRALRAGELLRTRVDVERSAQNQKLLESMDRRADLQLRLQKTVEGLSVVAISYYAVNLGAYALAPLAKVAGIEKIWLTAGLTPLVVLLVWMVIRKIRKSVH